MYPHHRSFHFLTAFLSLILVSQLEAKVSSGIRPLTATAPAMMFQGGTDPELSTARNRPVNRTGQAGVDLGSRNYNWSLPLVSLPGRAGLDLELTLYYNSLVWTKQGTENKLNLNKGFPGKSTLPRAPGFELHFPYVQQKYTNQDYGGFAYMVVTPSGGRVEFRQIGSSNVYEAADGSYAQLTDVSTNVATMRTTDGTLYTFGAAEMGPNQFGQQVVKSRRCTQIKDRNGNFISATYNSAGGFNTITDTLGRVITFNYDVWSPQLLLSISTTRNGAPYTLVTFSYVANLFNTNFGPPPDIGNNLNGTTIQVISQVNLPDGSYYGFSYNGYAQAYRITKYAADGHALTYTNYNLPLDTSVQQTDCPRFTERREWVENGVMGVSQEIITNYTTASDNSWSQMTTPDGTVHKEYFYTTGWQKGLSYLSEVWSGGVRKKWTTTSWTQDDVSLTYQKNPRVYDSITEDAEGNRRHVDITYSAGYSLPTEVREYSADGSGYAGFIRRTYLSYNLAQAYLDRRIIGLLETVHVVDENNNYVQKLSFEYDRGGEYLAGTPAAATQHDGTNFSTSFVAGRGNRTDSWRWDVTDINNAAKAIRQSHSGYNINGSAVFSRDALNRQTTFSYGDSFSDGNNSRNTFAFPTTITDEDSFASTVQYNYDSGLMTRTQDPKGAVTTITYDSADRVSQITSQFNNAYTRWVYPTSMNYVQRYTTLQNGAGEGYSADFVDGWGRLRATLSDHPGSTGGYSARLIYYDAMGRAVQETKPTEINSSWATVGDDAAGWIWTYQTYDWSGRPLVTTNPDTSTRENTYGGCGCAGGGQTTARDERGRRKRYTKDVLGRLVKVEELNWDQSVYSTTNFAYNGRDQLTSSSQGGQIRTLAYDGYGRLQSRTTPEQGTTTYSYFADDTAQTITDARNASMTFSYNNRKLMTGITYGVPGGVAATPNVTFGYDSAGNRTSMNDGLGSVSYVYDTLSRMTSETRTFTGVGSYALTYAYNLAGQMTSITNPWGAQVGYGYDKVGRPTNVSGSGYAGVSSYVNSIAYRAFGMKQMSYGNGRTLSLQFDNRMRVTQWNIPAVMGWNYAYQYFGENTGRVTYAQNLNDATLDRSFHNDQVGRLQSSFTGSAARAHVGIGSSWASDGPYAMHDNVYDVWGNLTQRTGWGGTNPQYGATFTNNKMNGMVYDASGNLADAGGGWTFTYDATGQQAASAVGSMQNSYDGDRLRGKKTENGVTTYYLRSSVLGGQVVAELNSAGAWSRGYVYFAGQVLAVQQAGVYWMHQDPYIKSKRVTDGSGNVVSSIELDPWGGETNRSSNEAFQPRKFTTYERDAIGSDDAMNRRYNRWWGRFEQPDPYDGSYNLLDPQTFNRYSYVQNDPISFVDPSGLCAFNIIVSDPDNLINDEAERAMQAEISRIFNQAGQTVNFGPAPTGLTYHLNLANVAATVLPNALGVTRGNPNGTITPYGAAYPNRMNAGNAANASDKALARHPVNKGTAVGRVVSHEAGHYLLQLPNAQHTASGLMRPQFSNDSSLYRQGGDFDRSFQFSLEQRFALNKLCETVTTDTTVPNTTPNLRPLRPIARGGDSGITRPGLTGGNGGVRVGGIGPLSWLEWLYGSPQRGKGELVSAKPTTPP